MSTSTKICCGPGYASPAEAMQAPREKLLYTIAIYVGTGIQKPDYLATVDADPDSLTYSQAVSYTHLRAHETPEHLVCRLLLEKKN